MIMPMTTWHWSKESEANRLIQTAVNIGNGFFHLHNFLPMSDEYAKAQMPNEVYLPRIAYSTIPNFWKKVAQLNHSVLPIIDRNDFTDKLLSLMPSNLSEPDDNEIKSQWSKYGRKIIGEIYKLIPERIYSIITITVYLTRYGTTCSFNVPNTWPSEIVVFLRHDQGIFALTEAIISSLIKNQALVDDKATWDEIEAVVDWLLLHSPLSKTLKPFLAEGTLTTVRRHNKTREKMSEDFLKTIGAPNFYQTFSIKNNQVIFDRHRLVGLTAREDNILKALINKSPNILTFDQMAMIVGMNEENFSLTTLAKMIERLRRKVEKNGLTSSYIATASGQGYYLLG
jgi:hypothetical protein